MIDLAVITARAGSKRLPGKNITDLGGVPLIAWTIRAALTSGLFRRVIVSTENVEIATASQAAGAEVPFERPAHLATSEARSVDVVRHALDATSTQGSFALLQPTSPFRNAHHLLEAAERFAASPAASLVSVVKGKPLTWQFSVDAEGRMTRVRTEGALVHRCEDAAPLHTPNGAIYLCHADRLRADDSLFFDDTLGYAMSQIDSLDIDDPEDLALARAVVGQGLRKIDT
jgi:CMP-N-acetylneuraminic acid synthetase